MNNILCFTSQDHDTINEGRRSGGLQKFWPPGVLLSCTHIEQYTGLYHFGSTKTRPPCPKSNLAPEPQRHHAAPLRICRSHVALEIGKVWSVQWKCFNHVAKRCPRNTRLVDLISFSGTATCMCQIRWRPMMPLSEKPLLTLCTVLHWALSLYAYSLFSKM